MLTIKRISQLSLVLLLSTPFYAAAYPVLNVDKNGQLTGASNVEVNGGLYDVEFVLGTCAELFTGCDVDKRDPFFFDTYSEALLSLHAISDQVIVGEFDDDPSLVRGCGEGDVCTIRIAWDLLWAPGMDPWRVEAQGHSFYNTGINSEFSDGFNTGTDLSINFETLFPVWSIAEVPEPASIGIFLLGGIGFLAARRKCASHRNGLSA